jgi:uncharacterized protein YjeT (DUF2065 family)
MTNMSPAEFLKIVG